MNDEPILNKEAEIELLDRYRAGDQEAGTSLVLGYKPLISSLATSAYRRNRRFTDRSDLLAAGFEGFLFALRRAKVAFSHNQGWRLGTICQTLGETFN